MEDDRFEADLLIETNRLCLARLELLYSELENRKDDVRMTDGVLSAVDKRAIRRLYGKCADEVVMLMLKLAPRSTLPVVIKRMKEKEEQWLKEKVVLENVRVARGGER